MYTESELVRIAKRENNSKRSYLVINKLQGKHVPVSPTETFALFDALADKLEGVYANETLLLIGFAETATAIGARLAIRLNAYYMQTTRERIPDVSYLFFTESHSHATEQKLVRDDIEKLAGKVDRIVFVEDEVTTGNTILHIIDLLERQYPFQFTFSVASLLNGMGGESLRLYAARGIDLHYLVKTNQETYAKQAEDFAGDGEYRGVDTSACSLPRTYVMSSYVDARRCTTGAAYEAACESLWKQVWEKLFIGAGEKILVVGTEEFMYPAIWLGACLERCGNTVRCHSTTRSPILAGREDGYLPRSRYALVSFYETERKTFLYDISRYDRVFIVTDAKGEFEMGERSLVNALTACGNEKIELIRWCEA